MKNVICKTLATAIIAMVILSAIPAIRAAPPTAPAFWIEPETLNFDTRTTNVGDKFNVTVWISTSAPIFTWQTKVTFDTTQLNIVRADYTGVGKSQFLTGHSTVPVSPLIDNATGFIVDGESLIGSDSAAPGSGSLFWIEFQIMAAPTGDQPLTSTISCNNPDTFMLDPNLDTITGVNFGAATYTFSPPPPVRDVAVTDLTLSNNAPKQGENVTITVTVLNNGTIVESFDVQISLDLTVIATIPITSLGIGSSQTITFEWNTSEATTGRHDITAYATVPTDVNTANDSMTISIFILSPFGYLTDLDGDGKVDMRDIAIAARAFGTHEGSPLWNPLADVNGDGIVNLVDIALIAKDFWKQ